jgi:hypothetical protein
MAGGRWVTSGKKRLAEFGEFRKPVQMRERLRVILFAGTKKP